MAKEEPVVAAAVLEQTDRVQDIGEFDVQLSMGNLVVTDRRGGLPRGYGTYTYTPIRSLTPQWRVIHDATGQDSSLRACRSDGKILVGFQQKRTAAGSGDATRQEPSTDGSAGGALAAAAAGAAALAIARWVRKRKKEAAPAAESPASTVSSGQEYQVGRAAQQRGDDVAARQAFQTAAAAPYDDADLDAMIATAASLFQVGLYNGRDGEKDQARIALGNSADLFTAVAKKAKEEGRPDLAQKAEQEAGRARSMAITIATGKPWLAPDFGGSERRQHQLGIMQRADEDRMRINQQWAQGLGRI